MIPLTQTMYYQKAEGVESLQKYSISWWNQRTNTDRQTHRSPTPQYSAANGNSG